MDPENKPNQLPCSKRLLYGLADWALLIAGLANLVVGTWSAFNDSAAVAATSLTAGLVLLFAATIDRFESIKGLGIEAKTKQLDNKIDQADQALRRLKEMTEITGAALIDLNSKMGRWGSAPGPRETIALAERVRKIMESLGSKESDIAAALRPWAKTLCLDMARVQTRDLQTLLQERVQALESERQRIPQPMIPDDPAFTKLSAQIRELSEFQTSRIKNLYRLELEDYPHRFMDIFSNVPQIDPLRIDGLRESAARFVPGMLSLQQNRSLAESEFWIETLKKEQEQ